MDEQTEMIVPVNLGQRSYRIHIGEGLLDRFFATLEPLGRITHVMIVSDSNVAPFFLARVRRVLTDHGVRTDDFVIPAGEESKSLAWAEKIWNWMLDVKADRTSVVVALGGGVVGDLAGFAAATFARGLRLVQIPTSLLAQVDSSVGGKVGVNLPQAKNMVGAFHQPAAVVIDVATLRALPQREYVSGLGEVVKYGMILDAAFFDDLEQHVAEILRIDRETVTRVVATCCRLKASIVEQDEREETGLRSVLNFGHTFAHAFETLTGYGQWLHGEAVAIGMVCASRLAERLGMLSPGIAARLENLLRLFGLPTRIGRLSPGTIMESMSHDKKVQHGQLRLVLPSRIGSVSLVEHVPIEDIQIVLEELQ